MGLDMYAYSCDRAGRNREYWESVNWVDHEEVSNQGLTKPKEIACWRKHPNLHGWMERLWEEKGRPGIDPNHLDVIFNGVELELTWEDMERLEQAVLARQLPATQGFFFGDDADEYYRDRDLQFIREARADLFVGLKVFYNSSW